MDRTGAFDRSVVGVVTPPEPAGWTATAWSTDGPRWPLRPGGRRATPYGCGRCSTFRA